METSIPPSGELWRRVASGIEAGVVGGIAMLVVLTCESLREDRVWWEIPNLLGSTFYGPRAFRTGPGMATVSGIALHLVITGTLGGLFGVFFGGIPQRGRLLVLGLLAAAGWYTLANAAFWPRVNPWITTTAGPPMVFSYLLLGACLGYMGRREVPRERAPRNTVFLEAAPAESLAFPDAVLLDSTPPGVSAPAALEAPLLSSAPNGTLTPELALHAAQEATPATLPLDGGGFAERLSGESLTPTPHLDAPLLSSAPNGILAPELALHAAQEATPAALPVEGGGSAERLSGESLTPTPHLDAPSLTSAPNGTLAPELALHAAQEATPVEGVGFAGRLSAENVTPPAHLEKPPAAALPDGVE